MLSEPCLICSKITEKLQYQINICYGCASFYRRSINFHEKYKCKKGKMNCFLKGQEKRLCRLCRYNSCQKYIQEIEKYDSKTNKILKIEYKLNRTDPWNIYDLFFNVYEMFQKPTISLSSISSSPDTFLPNFSETISQMIEDSLPKHEWFSFSPAEEATFKTAVFFNNFTFNSAKILSNFQCFQKIPLDEKLIIHDRFWQMFIVLRNCYVSNEKFGYGEFELRCLIDNFQYVDPASAKVVLEVDHENDGSNLFVVPYYNKLTAFYIEFRNAKITFFEFTYICSLVLWSFHSLPQMSQTTKNMGDKILEDVSIKLHEYYTKELRMSEYAGRQAKLFKIAFMIEGVLQSKTEMLKAWNLFNFGNHAFSFPKFDVNYFNYKN